MATSIPLWNSVSKTVDRSPRAQGSSASHSLETHTAQSSNLNGTMKPAARSLTENTGSSSPVWHSEVNPNTSSEKFVAETTKNPMSTRLFHHILRISRNYVVHLGKVYSGRTTKNLVVNPGNNGSSGTSWTRLSR